MIDEDKKKNCQQDYILTVILVLITWCRFVFQRSLSDICQMLICSCIAIFRRILYVR